MAEDSSDNRPKKRRKLAGLFSNEHSSSSLFSWLFTFFGRKKDKNEIENGPAPPAPVPLGHGNDLFSLLPQPCIMNIFSYVAASPDDVTDILTYKSVVQKIVPTIYLSSCPSASESEEEIGEPVSLEDLLSAEMTTHTMLQKLKNHQFLMGNENGRDYYEHMKVTGVEEFGQMKLSEALTITKDLFFEGIVSLDLSTTPSAVFTNYYRMPHTRSYDRMPHTRTYEYVSFLKVLLSMLPCLQEIDLTNTVWDDDFSSTSFPCSDCLEKLTWNRLDDDHGYGLGGISLKKRIPNIKNIKDISMDDYTSYTIDQDSLDSLLNLDQVSKKRHTIFSRLRSAKKLERLSILNLKLCYRGELTFFPQEALIKFVRNTLPPSVGWLRSDLSKANIDMLQLEYPNIEFVGS